MMQNKIEKRIGKRGTTYTIRLDVPSPDGSRKRVRLSAATEKELKAKIKELHANEHNGTFVQPDRQTFGDFLTAWLNSHKPNLRETTFSSYRQIIEDHIIPALGGTKLQKLTSAQLSAYYADKLANGRSNGKGGLSPRTVRIHYTIIREALDQAVKWNYVGRNVALGTNPPKQQRPQVQTWTMDQFRAFRAVAETDKLYPAIWEIAAGTGMRRGELLGLRWQDVDLSRGTIEVRQSLVKTTDNVIRFQEPKTKASRRTVALTPGLVDVLKRQQTRQKEWRLKLGPGWTDSGLVFTTQDGKAIHPANLYNRFKYLCEKAGVPVIRFHDLRHTHATDMLRRGIHPKIVSDRLGHGSIGITLDTYSHVLPDMQRQALAGLDDALFGT